MTPARKVNKGLTQRLGRPEPNHRLKKKRANSRSLQPFAKIKGTQFLFSVRINTAGNSFGSGAKMANRGSLLLTD